MVSIGAELRGGKSHKQTRKKTPGKWQCCASATAIYCQDKTDCWAKKSRVDNSLTSSRFPRADKLSLTHSLIADIAGVLSATELGAMWPNTTAATTSVAPVTNSFAFDICWYPGRLGMYLRTTEQLMGNLGERPGLGHSFKPSSLIGT